MLARIRNSFFPALQVVLVTTIALAVAACAKEKPPLIADDAAQRESAIPWNEQQKWEQEGQFGGMGNAMDGR